MVAVETPFCEPEAKNLAVFKSPTSVHELPFQVSAPLKALLELSLPPAIIASVVVPLPIVPCFLPVLISAISVHDDPL